MPKIKSIFHTPTQADYDEALSQLKVLTGDSLTRRNWETYGNDTCIYAGNYLTYGSDSWAVSRYHKTPQLFKVGMKIVAAPSDSNEYFIVVGQDNGGALKKIEELEAKVAELKAELTKPKEPLYKVVLPNPNSTALFVLKKDEEGKIILQRINHSQKYAAYTLLTKAEIKQDFEWAWQFAVEVTA